MTPQEGARQASEITQEPAPTEISETISNTIPFRILTKAVIHQESWEFPFWVASDVAPSDLAILWNAPFEITAINDEIHLHPSQTHVISVDHTLVTFMLDNRMTVYTFNDKDFKQFCQEISPEVLLFDQFGQLKDGQPYSQNGVILEKPIKHGRASNEMLLLLAAWTNCVIVYTYDVTTDQWCCNIQGDVDSRKILAKNFATAITRETLNDLGRYVTVKHGETTQIQFSPAEFGTPLHPEAFPTCIAIMLTRSCLDTMQCHNGVPITIKWNSRPLWSGTMDSLATAEIITTALMYTLSPVMKLKAVRLVQKGKQFASGPLCQCVDSKQPDANLTFFVTFELVGGAGPAATKTQLKQQVRNALAAWMLEMGQELSWIHSHLEEIVDNIGVKRLVPIIQQPAGTRRDSQLQQILNDAAIKLPEVVTKVQQSMNTSKAKARRKDAVFPDPAQYRIDCNFLLKEDGTPVSQLHEFKCQHTGVFLTNAAGALPWLRENQTLSSDELAILMLGQMPVETSLPTTQVVIPCQNADAQQVLLQATMIQFGSKHVKAKDWDQTSTKATSSKICSLTLWKQDWSDSEWHVATSQTTQFLKDVFAQEGLQGAITSAWGRTFRRGKQPTTYKDATSVQVHAAVAEEHFLALLRLTGYNRVWAAPKAEDGRLTDDFRILWFPAAYDIQKASAVTAKISGIAGLVRGKSSLGARITSSMFAAAWASVYPNDPAPIDVSNKWVYKLEPLPYGCNSAMLIEWGQHVNWIFRPLRATGPKSWLVCTGAEPPEGPLAFNGHPVLPRYMPQKHTAQQQPILAGPRARTQRNNTDVAAVLPASSNQDPWWNYNMIKGNVPTPAPATTAQGPTEQRLNQQDAKVQELEQKIEAMQTQQTQHTGQITQLKHDLVNTEQRIVQTMNQSMDGVKTDLTKSFGDALALQTKQFEASLLSLRQALVQTKRKSPTKESDEMSD
jgi:hypothetical protein